jgi:hypothetical protein
VFARKVFLVEKEEERGGGEETIIIFIYYYLFLKLPPLPPLQYNNIIYLQGSGSVAR